MLLPINNKYDIIPKKDIKKNGKYPVITQDEEYISGYCDTLHPVVECPLIVFGDHTCRVKYVNVPFARGGDGTKLLKINSKIANTKFIYYLISNLLKQDEYKRHYTILKQTRIPLPPLDIQQKIVDEIETVENKIKQKNQELLLLQGTVSNIIDNANTSNLMTIQDVCSMKITDGTHQTPIYCNKDEGIPFISAKDVTTRKIVWDEKNIKYITKELHEKLYKRIAPQRDDVLLAKNGTIGVAALVETDKIFDIYVTLAVLRPNKKIVIPKYLLYMVNSEYCTKQFNESLQKGMGVPNLHLNKIKIVNIPVPPLPEQQKIVAQIEELEKQIAEAQAIIDNSNQQKQEILDKYLK